MLSITNAKTKGQTIGWYNASIHLGLTIGSLIGFISLKFFSEEHIFIAYVLLCSISAIWTTLEVQENRFAYTKSKEHPHQIRQDEIGLLREPSIIAVLFGISLYGIGYGVFMTIIPTYMSSLEISNHNLSGLVFIAFYVGITLAQFIGGPIADKKGRILPMLGGLSLYSLGMLLFFRITSASSLLILSISSFGLGLFLVGSIALLNDQVAKSSKGFVSGLFYFFWGSGYFLGPIILGYVGKFNFYPQGFSAIGVTGLAASFLILFTYRSFVHDKKVIVNE